MFNQNKESRTMKVSVLKVAVIFGVILASVSACKKDVMQTNIATDDVSLLSAQAGNDNVSADAWVDTKTNDFIMPNAGIANDFLVNPEDVDLVQGPGGDSSANDTNRNRIREKSFMRCLHGLNLSEKQKAAIKNAAGDLRDCRKNSEERARAIYDSLRKVYKAKMERLQAAFKDGNITEEQFKKGIMELRHGFQLELRALHIKEKLEQAFRNCFENFLKKLKGILTEEQWKAFVKCHKR